ncbi:hypothetical protein [Sphingosinicella rhizophila]|uniref:Uncharacterized protein n=1 Tax=Sphingosinicella rhizophila TaxID=3050082 RepID=A0ABU3QBY3_9SPHN|nr:hypothetical protein [Sphingosinicella sp. GR2756]MDT9600649.1 hypothetical protein [Sphingosinicella sp. GR2756]
MTHYRVYKLDDRSGRIVKRKDVEAANDSQAMKQAADDDDCPVCEVWEGAKKIGSIEEE